MGFLADESCDAAVVRALRAAGYDVRAVVEAAPGSTDAAVLEMSASFSSGGQRLHGRIWSEQ